MSTAEFRRKGKLSDGMVIVAAVRARVLGMELLKVDANVTVSPTPPRVVLGRPAPLTRRLTSKAALPQSNGSIGNGLEAAALSLENTSRELNAARRTMP